LRLPMPRAGGAMINIRTWPGNLVSRANPGSPDAGQDAAKRGADLCTRVWPKRGKTDPAWNSIIAGSPISYRCVVHII